MIFGNLRNSSLVLGLGYNNDQEICSQLDHMQQQKKKPSLKYDHLIPCLTLGLPEETSQSDIKIDHDMHRQPSPLSPVSSFSNSSIKKERESVCGEELDAERVFSRVCDDDEEGASPRKKLRLTKGQSATLEDSFKEYNTLSPKQKHALAERLNLKPRQVEVWFQNRRARTKMKQTEVDCELLRKCRQNLTEENKRLQKELQELKSLKLAGPLHMQLPKATLTMCPSCQKVAGDRRR
ncbi:hypothetical protein K2173_007943 [Erythroxylum novogranatense]|uniref:Homeobox domain-containing protein n=1 Tax=Erythroxylum novogranatense TaxID=1862640 RepID=A0AAV8T858_9ROSI|nr:hypothetical protein K2173_007943 [Erythroxylum novogranatense]